jgi:phospholipid/cholesterol/gamma-HCH transport system permease protein
MHTHKTLMQWYQLSNEKGAQHIILSGSYTLTALEQVLDALAKDLAQKAKDPHLNWI